MTEHKPTLVAYLTSVWTFIVGLFSTVTAPDLAVYVGIFCTLGTFFINWYYRREEARIKRLALNIDEEEA